MSIAFSAEWVEEQAKLCLAGIEEILFCCGKHRTVEFGSLV